MPARPWPRTRSRNQDGWAPVVVMHSTRPRTVPSGVFVRPVATVGTARTAASVRGLARGLARGLGLVTPEYQA